MRLRLEEAPLDERVVDEGLEHRLVRVRVRVRARFRVRVRVRLTMIDSRPFETPGMYSLGTEPPLISCSYGYG